MAGGWTGAIAYPIASPLSEAEFSLEAGRAHLAVLASGRAKAVGPRMTLECASPGVAWLPQGTVERMRFTAGSRGELLALAPFLVARTLASNAIGGEIGPALSRPLVLGLCRERGDTLAAGLGAIRQELFSREPGVEAAATHRLALTFIEVWRTARRSGVHEIAHPQSIAARFAELVGAHLREHWPVSAYCEAVGTKADRLSRAVRSASGLSPRAFIHRELHREARELLLGSPLTIAEIAYHLGFKDPAYFNRFFARMEEIPPGRLRRHLRRREPNPDGSFAAWP